jgi:two-component system chemotaxis response regulator CheB
MGGIEALQVLLGGLPAHFPMPILIVHHISPEAGSHWPNLFQAHCPLRVKEADEEELALPGTVYLAPANYHLLIEQDCRLALSVDCLVNFSRPSVDVLFESAADVFGPALIGIVLTGAGSDGSRGLKKVKEKGGLAIIQDPADAQTDNMPRNALAAVSADHVLPLRQIAPLICRLAQQGRDLPSVRDGVAPEHPS